MAGEVGKRRVPGRWLKASSTGPGRGLHVYIDRRSLAEFFKDGIPESVAYRMRLVAGHSPGFFVDLRKGVQDVQE